MCLSDTTYMSHMWICLCAYMKQFYQFIYLIWTPCNQKCHQECSYTCISYYWYMPLNKCACHITLVCPTALLLQFTYMSIHMSKKKLELLFTMLLAYMCQVQVCPYMPNVCCICQLLHVQIKGNHVSIYTSCELTAINSVPRNTGIDTFHIADICPWTNMPASLHKYVLL